MVTAQVAPASAAASNVSAASPLSSGGDVSDFKPRGAHLRVICHALGMRAQGDRPFRNYFIAGEGHVEMPLLNELLVNDYVTVRDNPGGSGYLFRVTSKGFQAVAAVANELARADEQRRLS